MSEGHIPEETHNKPVAMLIAVLALILAFAEAGANNARTFSMEKNIEASDLWAFFQAKTIRRTVVTTAGEAAQLNLPAVSDPAEQEAMKKQIAAWKETAARFQSEPSTNEGSEELAERARKAQEERDLSSARFEIYELATHCLQVGIVLASAMIITGIVALAWLAGGLGIVAAVLMAFAKFSPLALAFLTH